MSGFLFDANVLLDIATADPNWLAWRRWREVLDIIQRRNGGSSQGVRAVGDVIQ